MRTALLALCLCLTAWGQGVPGIGAAFSTSGGGGGFTLISHTGAGSSNQNQVTTSGINTTGANLIVVGVASFAATPAISDSLSNSWTRLTIYTIDSNQPAIALFYCYAPTTGASHTFSTTTTGGPSIFVEAFSGSAASPFDQQNGLTNASQPSSNTIQPGSITPTANNELVITLVGGNAYTGLTVNTVNSSFTMTDYQTYDNSGYTHIAGAMGYLIQTTATAENPTWTASGGLLLYMTSTIASFK